MPNPPELNWHYLALVPKSYWWLTVASLMIKSGGFLGGEKGSLCMQQVLDKTVVEGGAWWWVGHRQTNRSKAQQLF